MPITKNMYKIVLQFAIGHADCNNKSTCPNPNRMQNYSHAVTNCVRVYFFTCCISAFALGAITSPLSPLPHTPFPRFPAPLPWGTLVSEVCLQGAPPHPLLPTLTPLPFPCPHSGTAYYSGTRGSVEAHIVVLHTLKQKCQQQTDATSWHICLTWLLLIWFRGFGCDCPTALIGEW